MKKSFKHVALALAGMAALTLASCTGLNLPGSTGGGGSSTGDERASMTGVVTKADGTAARNATMVLIRRENSADSDFQIVRTDGEGNYRFTGVPAGNYRLAFVLQSEDERKNKTTKYYDRNGEPEADREQTKQFYSFITTANFDYDGDTSSSFLVPKMNVGWVSNLSPHNTTVNARSPIQFSWSPAQNVQSYVVDVRDENNNPFYKSPPQTGTSFGWTDLKGNQGNNNGKVVEPGKTYYYLVATILDRPSGTDGPVPTSGGTALASFQTN